MSPLHSTVPARAIAGSRRAFRWIYALRRNYGGGSGDAALAAFSRKPAQATAAGRWRQEPPPTQLRATARHPACGTHLGVYQRGIWAAGDGESARFAAGKPA